MSTWTHIAGALSADDFGAVFGTENPAEHAKKVIGKWKDEWREAFNDEKYLPNAIEDVNGYYGSGDELPSGSEGSIRYVAQNIGRSNSCNNLVITFFGNLRDYGPGNVEEELIPWFEKMLARLKENRISVRCGSIHIITSGVDCTLFVDTSDYNNIKFQIAKKEQK